MIKCLIDYFQTGEIEKHKEAQRHWLRDKNPVVEANLGFNECYLDPLGTRAEFGGFVAIKDKSNEGKFGVLVEKAEELIDKLPWSRDFEVDKFIKPDYT